MVAPLGEGATPRENCLFVREVSGSSCTKTSPTGGRDRGGRKQAAGRPSRPESPGIYGQPVPSPTREGPTPEVARDQMSPPNPPQRGWAQTKRRRRRCQGRREGECRSPQRTRAEPAARRHAAERGAAGTPRPGPLSSPPVPPRAPGPPARPPGGRRGACRVPPRNAHPPRPRRGAAPPAGVASAAAPPPPPPFPSTSTPAPPLAAPAQARAGDRGGTRRRGSLCHLPKEGGRHPWEGRPGQDEGGGLTGGPARPPTPSVVEKRSL